MELGRDLTSPLLKRVGKVDSVEELASARVSGVSGHHKSVAGSAPPRVHRLPLAVLKRGVKEPKAEKVKPLLDELLERPGPPEPLK